jgi:hypothetical protein
MKESLEQVTKIIEWLKDPKNKDASISYLTELLRGLTGHLYTLEQSRAEYHDQYEKVVYKLVNEGASVARATNEANVLIPEMYMLRRIMDAAYANVDSLRTIISFKKQEFMNQNV